MVLLQWFSVGCQSVPHGILAGFHWVSYVFVGCQWDYLGILVGFHWVSVSCRVGCQWAYYGPLAGGVRDVYRVPL